MKITLADLKHAISEMYSQLDHDKIDEWEVDGLDIIIQPNDEDTESGFYTLTIKKVA